MLTDVQAPSDAELISAVRGGDTDAYGELFRRHVEAARRLARQLVPGPDADDLVSEAFAKVLTLLRRGAGPDLAFRAYLLTAVRRLHVDRLRAEARLQPADDLTPFDPGTPFRDTAVEGFENAAAARAFASLPERWQVVLWHTEVEGQRPAEVAPLLGLSANSVSALAYRAREGLRQAFLTMHVRDVPDADCAWVHERLGAQVRGALRRRDSARVEEHVGRCHRCAAAWLELDDLNRGLAGLLGPLLLGAAAAGYLGPTGGSAAGGGVLALLARLRHLALAHAPATAAAGLAAGAVVVSGVLLRPHEDLTGRLPGSATREVSTPAVTAPPPWRDPHRAGPVAGAGAAAGGPAGGTTSSTGPEPAGPASGASAPTGTRSSHTTTAGPAQPGPGTPAAAAPTPGRGPGTGTTNDRPRRHDVDLRVTVEGAPGGGSASVGVTADSGVPGNHPIRRRIVVGLPG